MTNQSFLFAGLATIYPMGKTNWVKLGKTLSLPMGKTYTTHK